MIYYDFNVIKHHKSIIDKAKLWIEEIYFTITMLRRKYSHHKSHIICNGKKSERAQMCTRQELLENTKLSPHVILKMRRNLSVVRYQQQPPWMAPSSMGGLRNKLIALKDWSYKFKFINLHSLKSDSQEINLKRYFLKGKKRRQHTLGCAAHKLVKWLRCPWIDARPINKKKFYRNRT